jgi:MYXO-CTERM domain-containing protein
MAAIASCGADPPGDTEPSEGQPSALEMSPGARARIDALRARFRAVIGAGIATAFVTSRGQAGSVRALMPAAAKRGLARTASVELPTVATGFVRVEDHTSQLSVRFAVRDANNARIAVADGIAIYADALPGADVVHRVHAEGTEDFVVFEQRPAREELVYTVDVAQVSGLRLLSNTLEFLDEGGSPRLRVAPPYVVDSGGVRHRATLAVEGCAYDVDPAPPWRRAVTRPGAQWCAVRVAWAGAAYPAVMDPAWTTTGSMAEPRDQPAASVLASGNVLVSGGRELTGFTDAAALASAELYDPAAGAFAATGSMTHVRYGHTASVLASGKVLVAGGETEEYDVLDTAELYDPASGVFSATGSMAYERMVHTATVLASGKVLVAGGWSDTRPILASAELYDPAAGTFSPTGSMVMGRISHTASVLGSGKVLMAGGGGVELLTAELYDPVAGTFTATGAMTAVRQYHTASVLGSGRVLVVGGAYPDVLATAELYDPESGIFSVTGAMADARFFHTATVLGSGNVLVAGGQDVDYDALATAELYDAVAGTFSTAGSMAQGRENHIASVLESGNVLVAGGTNGAGSSLASAEVHDLDAMEPSTGSSSSSGGGATTSSSTTTSANTGATTSGSATGEPHGANPGATGGCGCRVEPSHHAANGWLVALACFTLAVAKRRRSVAKAEEVPRRPHELSCKPRLADAGCPGPRLP